MIEPEERDRLAESGLAALAADSGVKDTAITAWPADLIAPLAEDVVIDLAWYLHTRGLSKDAIDTILYDAVDKFDTEYKLPERN